MATRTAEVKLRLVTDQYMRAAAEAAAATERLDRSTKQVDADLKKLPPDAAAAAAALKGLGTDAKTASEKVRESSDKVTKANTDLSASAKATNAAVAGIGRDGTNALHALDLKIVETRGEVKRLGDEFVRTGSVDVFRKLGDADSRLKELEKIKKKVGDALTIAPAEAGGFFKNLLAKAEEAGQKIGQILPDAVSGALSTPVLGPIIGAALIGAIAAAATTVLATAGGLVLAGAGAGIAGAGIMGAILGDPEVTGAAWKTAIGGVKDDFLSASSIMRGPLIAGAHEFEGVLRGIDMAHIFAQASGYLPMLIDGAAAMARWLGKAAGYLVDGAGPEMAVLAQELPKLGHAVAVASQSIAAGGEGGAQALKDLLGVVEVVIAGVGGLIGAGEKWYLTMVKIRDAVIPRNALFPPEERTHIENAARALTDVGNATKGVIVNFDDMSKQVTKTGATMSTVTGQMVAKIFNATMSLDQAYLGVAESLTKVEATFKQNGLAIDKHTGQVAMNTEKGQANRESVLASVTANMQVYQSQLAAGMGAEQAAANYDANTASLEANLHKAGLNTAQIDDLIGKYRGIPAKVDSDIAIHGLTDAIDRLDETIRKVNGLDGRNVDVYFNYHTRGQALNAPMATGGYRRAAVGMTIPPSDPGTTLVGEPQTGGELLLPLRGITEARAMSLARPVLAGYGADVVPRGMAGYRAGAPSPGVWAAAAQASASHSEASAAGAAAASSRGTAREIRAALEGLAVVMDGQVVGRIQGLQADRYRRGG